MAERASRETCVIYGSALAHRGGTGVYLRRLLRGLVQLGADVLVAAPGGAVSPAEALRFEGWPEGVAKVFLDHAEAPGIARSAGAALVHLPAFAGRAPKGVPSVVTVHDMAYMARPSWFPLLRSVYYRLLFTRIARRARLVMADSRFTASELQRLAGLDPDGIRTVYLSADNARVDPTPLLDRLRIEPEYLLCVGTVEPRKNIPALLDAMELLRRDRPDLRLLLAGRWGWGSRGLRRRLEVQEGVLWAGALGAEDLERAYCGASLLVYPSLYEGFGLPPLEAARAGVSSVVGPAVALREVYADAAFHSGGDPTSLAETVGRALEAPAPAGMESLVETLTNERMAKAVMEVYGEVLR